MTTINQFSAPISAQIVPDDILYYYDEPLTFVANTPYFPILCYKFDETANGSVYLAVQTNSRIISGLKNGHISLRRALHNAWCWVIEANSDFAVISSNGFDMAGFPEELLPERHAGLYSHHGFVPDSIQPLASSRPFMSVYFKGGSLGESIPFGVFRTLVDEAYDTLRKVFSPIIRQYRFSEASISNILQIPVRPPAFASLSLEIDRPEADFARVRTNGLIPLQAHQAREQFEGAAGDFMDSVSEITGAARKDRLSKEFAFSHYNTLNALVQITPHKGASFDTVQINADFNGTSSVFIDASTGATIKESFREIARERHDFVGEVIEVSARSNTFIIRRDDGREITCAMIKNIGISTFADGMKVTVSGLFSKRTRRDHLYVAKVALPDGTVIAGS